MELSVKDQVLAALKERDEQINQQILKANDEIAMNGKMHAETAEALNKLAKSGSELVDRLTALEQLAVNPKGAQADQRSIGEQFTDTDDFKRLAANGRGTASMRLKAVTNITSAVAGTGAAGAGIAPDRRPGLIGPALRQFTIRDLLMQGRTNSNLIQYVKETGFQNMAATVAEGAAKPQGDIAFTLVSTPVVTIAYWVKASNQILADVPQLQSYIDTRMRYGLAYVEEGQILSGDGVGSNLLGLIPQATAYNVALNVAGDNNIDQLRRAILQVRIAEYRASGIVLNPADLARLETIKASTSGVYLWGNPAANAPNSNVWRLPVIDTNSMPVGKFMVGAFDMAAQLFDREDANVQVSSEDADNFTKNMVTVRAEERLGLAVYRPESFVYGTFT